MKRERRIRIWMNQEGLNQRELSEKLELSETAVSKYLSGQRRIGWKPAMKLAEISGIPLKELLG